MHVIHQLTNCFICSCWKQFIISHSVCFVLYTKFKCQVQMKCHLLQLICLHMCHLWDEYANVATFSQLCLIFIRIKSHMPSSRCFWSSGLRMMPNWLMSSLSACLKSLTEPRLNGSTLSECIFNADESWKDLGCS